MNAHPLQKTHQATVQAVVAGSDKTTGILVVPFDAAVESVVYVPDGDIAGANTDTRKIALVNKAQDGNGAVEIAALQFNNGVNASDFDEKALTNSTTAANLNIAAGDVLAFASTHIGTGIADTGGIVKVVFSKR